MAETWELTQYVEAHPDNKGQRWRLAKKLYGEEDYRLAVEHLQILSNEWKDKSGVPRYLAATYMRLGLPGATPIAVMTLLPVGSATCAVVELAVTISFDVPVARTGLTSAQLSPLFMLL